MKSVGWTMLAVLVVGCAGMSDSKGPDTDIHSPPVRGPSQDGEEDSILDSSFEPQTGGVPWNGISWLDMPWELVPTEALGTSDYPGDGRVALDTSHTSGLEQSADGRLVLRYLAQCALPAGAALIYDDGHEVHEWPGTLALATEWVYRPIDDEERAWVSACILASVNPTGFHVAFSPRGHHPALEDRLGAEEADRFAYEEAAFYGDIFADPPITYVCVGEDLATIETDVIGGAGRPTQPETALTPQDYLRYRLCAWLDCGIEHTGRCYSLTDAHVCIDRPDRVSSHDPCYDSEEGLRNPQAANRYDAVITTYLTADDAGKFEERARDGQTP